MVASSVAATFSQNKEGGVQLSKRSISKILVTRPEQKTQPEEEETDNTALLLTGTSKSGVQYKGHVEIPNLSDENSVDEVEVCAF